MKLKPLRFSLQISRLSNAANEWAISWVCIVGVALHIGRESIVWMGDQLAVIVNFSILIARRLQVKSYRASWILCVIGAAAVYRLGVVERHLATL